MLFVNNLVSDLAAEVVLVLVLAGVSALALRYRARVRRVTAGRHVAAPDGQKASYERDGEIYVAGGAGGLRNLTRHPAQDTDPIWSPDSRWLAFLSDRDGSWQVWVADVEDGMLVCLTNTPGAKRPIGWGPDGDLLINFGGSQLFVGRAEIAKRLAEARR